MFSLLSGCAPTVRVMFVRKGQSYLASAKETPTTS